MNAGVPHGKASEASLRAAFAHAFQVGCALGGKLPDALSLPEQDLVRSQFDVVTPENCMKPGPLQPEPGRYDFTTADAFVQFAEDSGLRVVGHCLCWHQQSPAWCFAPGMERKSALDQLALHIRTVAGRYRGRLQGWDVVNEAIVDRPEGAGEYLRDTPALRAIGQDYVERAFELAREADPSAELYYNDYNIELADKRERTLRLVDGLLARGAPIDGVGIQGHWQLDKVPFEEIRAAIAAYRALGLKVMITELDLDVVDRPDAGADVAAHRAYSLPEDIYRDGCPPAVLQRQAEQYARLFEIFAEQPGAVSRVTFWGLHDGGSWLNHWPGKRTNHPLLFDRASLPKPAFASVIQAAGKAP
jgi:endo-1,4-beta-xylanase